MRLVKNGYILVKETGGDRKQSFGVFEQIFNFL
jgi:hypothetical protein